MWHLHPSTLPFESNLTALESSYPGGWVAQQQPLSKFGVVVKYCDIGDLLSFTWIFVLLETLHPF